MSIAIDHSGGTAPLFAHSPNNDNPLKIKLRNKTKMHNMFTEAGRISIKYSILLLPVNIAVIKDTYTIKYE